MEERDQERAELKETKKQSAPTAKETDVVLLLVFVAPRVTSHYLKEIGEHSGPKEVEPLPPAKVGKVSPPVHPVP